MLTLLLLLLLLIVFCGFILVVIFFYKDINFLLFLIICFLLLFFFWSLLNQHFLALLVLIIYAGAVAVLFLFILLMLDLKIATYKYSIKFFTNISVFLGTGVYITWGVLLSGVAFCVFLFTSIPIIPNLLNSFFYYNANVFNNGVCLERISLLNSITQLLFIWNYLIYLFLGGILLATLIGAILLVYKYTNATRLNSIRNPANFRILSRLAQNVSLFVTPRLKSKC